MVDNLPNGGWHLGRDGQVLGPISDAELNQLLASGRIEPTDLLWKLGMADWQTAALFFPAHFGPTARPQTTHPSTNHAPPPSNPAHPAGLAISPAGLPGAIPERADRRADHGRPPSPSPSRSRSLLAAMAAAAVLGGVGIAWQLWPAAEQPSTVTAPTFSAAGLKAEDVDSDLQRALLWRALKRDWADWYARIPARVAELRAADSDVKVVNKFLADAVVRLRREQAKTALNASAEHLRNLARAYLTHLDALADRDAQTCWSYITFGEANPAMIELSNTPQYSPLLQQVLVLVFEAAVDGRKAPRAYSDVGRPEFDLLTQELTARGWTKSDLETFTDPRQLSNASPDFVCNKVRDWFRAHLALKDDDAQARLLSQTLRPLILG